MADVTALIMDDHEWFRRQFARLDDARTGEELSAIWQPLAQRLEAHAQAEETIFYPALLRYGGADGAADGQPADEAVEETTDAIADHNKIRDAIAEAGRHEPSSPHWLAAVGRARSENSEHLAEEEDEGLPDFRKHASAELRQTLGEQWLQFYATHQDGRSISTADVDPQEYLDQHT